MLTYESAIIAQQTIDSDELAILIQAALAGGSAISFNAPGRSMAPFIRSEDKIFVAPVAKALIRTGDALAFVHPDTGRVLVHRVIRISDGQYFLKGDNVKSEGDGWISFEDVLGRVVRIQRDEKEIHLGLGVERKLIALLSRWKMLVPLVNFLRRIKWGFKRLITAQG